MLWTGLGEGGGKGCAKWNEELLKSKASKKSKQEYATIYSQMFLCCFLVVIWVDWVRSGDPV